MGSSGSYNVQQSSLNQSIWAVVNLLWYVNASSSLYLYCITGSKFRRRFLHILASLWSCLCARHRQPVTKTSSTLSSVDELVRSVLPQLRAPQQTINKEIQRTCNQRSSNGDSIVSTTVLWLVLKQNQQANITLWCYVRGPLWCQRSLLYHTIVIRPYEIQYC